MITITREIKAPVSFVFKTISDIRIFSTIVPEILDVEFISETKEGIGTHYRESRVAGSKTLVVDLHITDYVKDQLVRIVTKKDGAIWDAVCTVEPTENGTILVMQLESKAEKLFPKLKNWLIAGFIRRTVEKDVDRVQTYCQDSVSK